MDYITLREMIKENCDEYEFVEFLWAHLSNNPNIVVGLLEPVEYDKYCFKYRFIGDSKIYSHNYSLAEIAMNIKRRCGYFKGL